MRIQTVSGVTPIPPSGMARIIASLKRFYGFVESSCLINELLTGRRPGNSIVNVDHRLQVQLEEILLLRHRLQSLIEIGRHLRSARESNGQDHHGRTRCQRIGLCLCDTAVLRKTVPYPRGQLKRKLRLCSRRISKFIFPIRGDHGDHVLSF